MASAASAGSAGGTLRLLDLLLDEQQRLTAVERFAKRHAPEHPDPLYRDLIPLDAPGAGQQLAFQVDLDRCTGCKACVTACHSLNGLDEDETWRSVGRLVGRSGEAAGVPVQQSVTGACHHCEDPACLSGCPVRAYDKDPVTGIVRHLDDQCIGCRYCQLTCPYDVPRFNERLGIVRKCDMCADRLAEGEAPACVQGCPNGAIAIEIVERGASGARTLLPMAEGAAADPAHTRPTTRYVTRLADAQLAAPDADRPEPAAGHDPLALMLVLVQAALGVLLCEAGLRVAGLAAAPGSAARLAIAAAVTASGLVASTFHLGRPLYAFRAFLGWRTSWMSREVLALGGFLGVLAAAAASALCAAIRPDWPLPLGVGAWIGLGVALGLATTLSSVMIYAATHRRWWALRRTAVRFVGTVAVAACLAGALSLTFDAPAPTLRSAQALLGIAGAVALAKLALELGFLRRRHGVGDLARSARLLAGALRGLFRLRAGLTLGGAALLGLAVVSAPSLAGALALLALPLLLGGELVERHLFFTAEAARSMPGA